MGQTCYNNWRLLKTLILESIGTTRREKAPKELNWTKRGILFELSSWRILKLRRNLHVMHAEQNICENVLGTLLKIEEKTNDMITARLDLEDLNIKKELYL